MTLPCERIRAVNYTRQFLLDLCDPVKTPKVPKKFRDQARALLKHYPTTYDMTVTGNGKNMFIIVDNI